jgi:hypothetical protein
MRRPRIRQRLLSTLRISLPDFDPVICRRSEYPSAVEIDVKHGDTVRVARLEFFSFGHGARRGRSCRCKPETACSWTRAGAAGTGSQLYFSTKRSPKALKVHLLLVLQKSRSYRSVSDVAVLV